jgi:hypothetical protein
MSSREAQAILKSLQLKYYISLEKDELKIFKYDILGVPAVHIGIKCQ